MREICFVNVSGFNFSGSSAVVDLLKEFRGAYEANAEIRFIRDPYGIIQMENTLINQWDWINASAAISDFLNIMKKSARPKGVFLPMGFGFKKKINPDFLRITEEYIQEITEFTYKTDFYHYKFKKSFIKYQLDRYRQAIEFYSKGRIKAANRNIETCYFSHPTQEQFNQATRRFFNKLFADHVANIEAPFVILDQAIPINNTDVMKRYFSQSRMIVVDRDPRDIYCDTIEWGEMMDDEYQNEAAARRFVLKAKAIREGKVQDDVLYVRFEDLVLKYEETKQTILNYLGLSDIDHVLKGRYLKPEVSRKNIGIWKKHYADCSEALDYIKRELSSLCYE